MKRSLSLLLLLFLVAGAKAQVIDTLFKENFEGSKIKFGEADPNGCTSRWYLDSTSFTSGIKNMKFPTSQTCPAYLVSVPVTLDTKGLGDSVYVYYDLENDYSDYGDSLFVGLADTGLQHYYLSGAVPVNSGHVYAYEWITYRVSISVKKLLSYKGWPNFRVLFGGFGGGSGGLGDIFLTNIRIVEVKRGIPTLTFTTPKPTDTVYTHTNMNIAWTDSSLAGSNIDLYLLSTTSSNYSLLGSNIAVSSGYTTANLYNSITPGYYVLAAFSTGTVDSISYSAPFYVTNPYVKILNPKGGETLYAGKTIKVKWASKEISKIELKLWAASTGTTTILDASLPASQDSTTLLLPNTLTEDNYNMIASDIDNNGYGIGDTTSNFIIDTGKSGIMPFPNGSFPLIVYPNPSNGVFRVNMPAFNGQYCEEGLLQIYSAEGNEVYSRNVNCGDKKLEVNLNGEGLPAGGLYLVRLKTSNAVYQSKISVN